MFNCLILCVFNPQDIQPEESANRERFLTGELWPLYSIVQVNKLKYVYFL